jgi:hypothetical protein
MEIGVMFEAVTSDIEGIFYNMSGAMPRFAARRSYRPRAMFAGLGFMLVCVAISVGLGASNEYVEMAPYVAGAGALAYFVATIVAMIPQAVTIEIKGTAVRPSWRPEITRERVVLSNLVAAGVDAAMGVAVEISGPGGRVRIGANGHDGEGYALGGKPLRSVDCHVDKGQLEALLRSLAIEKGPPGPLVIPLVRSGQSFGAIARGMGPILIAIAAMSLFGLVLANTRWGDELMKSETGRLVVPIVCTVLAIGAVVAMIVRRRRVRRPEVELRFDREALIIADPDRDRTTRVPWRDVTIEKLTYKVSSRVGTFSMPVLVVTVPERKLRIGAWDTALAWPGQPANTWRAPTWVVGAAIWPKLLDVLKRNSRL